MTIFLQSLTQSNIRDHVPERTDGQETCFHSRLAISTGKRQSANPNPPPYVEARFASGENLTWLLEMGYCPNTKAPSGQTATALCAHLPETRHWVKVGENAEMLGWGEYPLHGCAYPLTAAMKRFKVGRRFKYAVLLHMCEENAPFPTLPVWFHHYNERQTVEAGNKEMKGTFHVQHLTPAPTAGAV